MGEVMNSAFGSAIGYGSCSPFPPPDGTDVNDLTILLLDHMWKHILTAKKRPLEIDLHKLVPLLFPNLP